MGRKFKAGEFSPHQYKVNNEWGISRVITHLKRKGFEIIEKEEEDYQIDIEAVKDGKTYYYEAEVKTGYPFTDADTFKFPTVSFLGRKKKYHERCGGFYYAIVCRETECLLYCHSSVIYQEEFREIRTINTKHRKGKDEFYRVPKHLCTFVALI